jgi:uncharacterized protein (TIGR00369 family)
MPTPDPSSGLDELLGTEFLEITGDVVRLRCEVTARLWQPYGIVHGGVYCALVETATSLGAASWLGDAGHVVGVANHTNFLRAVRSGTLHVLATPVHRGRSQQLWQARISDDTDRTVALGEVRLHNLSSADGLGR